MSIRLALLGKRIHIIGSVYHLQQQSVQDKIRACLLAGVLPFCGVKSAAANGNCYFIVKISASGTTTLLNFKLILENSYATFRINCSFPD